MDWYTNVVLTVIAMCQIVLVVRSTVEVELVGIRQPTHQPPGDGHLWDAISVQTPGWSEEGAIRVRIDQTRAGEERPILVEEV